MSQLPLDTCFSPRRQCRLCSNPLEEEVNHNDTVLIIIANSSNNNNHNENNNDNNKNKNSEMGTTPLRHHDRQVQAGEGAKHHHQAWLREREDLQGHPETSHVCHYIYIYI